jgi:hypothetical protein
MSHIAGTALGESGSVEIHASAGLDGWPPHRFELRSAPSSMTARCQSLLTGDGRDGPSDCFVTHAIWWLATITQSPTFGFTSEALAWFSVLGSISCSDA